MNIMYEEMVLRKNITDVSFMILNMKRAAATINELTKRVSFPVYQEPASQDIMGMLGGVKDDILIYDRCGLLVDHFTMPWSYLGYSFVRNSLKKVVSKNSKCRRFCPVMTTLTTVTTTQPSTSQQVSTNSSVLTSESVTSQPRSELATACSSEHSSEGFNSNKAKQNKESSRGDTL